MKPAATSRDIDASEAQCLIPQTQAHFHPTLKCLFQSKKSLLNYFTCGTGSFRPVLAKASHLPVTPYAHVFYHLTFHEKKTALLSPPRKLAHVERARSASVITRSRERVCACTYMCVCACRELLPSCPPPAPAALNKAAPRTTPQWRELTQPGPQGAGAEQRMRQGSWPPLPSHQNETKAGRGR